MMMPLRDLRAIYELLFRDGVMVAKKDKRPQTKHPEIPGVGNLQVIRAMGSLKSKGYLRETFAWRHFYWYLTNEGIVYLRDYLRLPPEIVPASLQRVRRPAATLGIAHRAARVQSVEGPTSYVPKPGGRGESYEALAERQGYRHKMMGAGEEEGYSDRTPRFRGRPLAAEPVRPRASWESEDQAQPPPRKGRGYHSEAAMIEGSQVKRVAMETVSQQGPDVSSRKPVMASQEKRASEVYRVKAQGVQAQKTTTTQEVSVTTLKSVPSKAALPLAVAAVAVARGIAAVKVSAESSSIKTGKGKPKRAEEEASKMAAEPITIKPTTSTPLIKGVKEEKTKEEKVNEKAVKAPQLEASAEIKIDKEKPQQVTTMAATQETPKLPADTATTNEPIVSPPPIKEVKEEKAEDIKSAEEPPKAAEVKVSVESPISTTDKEKAKKTAIVTVTQETPQLPSEPATSKPAPSTDALNEEKTVEMMLTHDNTAAGEKPPAKLEPDVEIPRKAAKMTISEEIPEVTLEPAITTMTISAPCGPTEEVKYVKEDTREIEVIKEEKTPEVEMIQQVENGETVLESVETPKSSAEPPKLSKKDAYTPHINDVTVTTVTETKTTVIEESSKSKKKKNKSQGEEANALDSEEPPAAEVTAEKASNDKVPGEVAQNVPKPTPVITSESPTLSTTIKPEGPSPVEEKTPNVKQSNVMELKQETPKPVVDQSIAKTASPPSGQLPAAPPVEPPVTAQVKEKVEETSISKIAQGPAYSTDEITSTKLTSVTHTKTVKSETEITVTELETVTVEKTIKVELAQVSSKPAEKKPAILSESQKPALEPAAKATETINIAVEGSSKSKKKGKGKKQGVPVSEQSLDTKHVNQPAAEPLLSTEVVSLPKATVKDDPVTASEPTIMTDPPNMPPERMCSEEIMPAAAVLTEAPADKGEEEPAPVFAEKIKREDPKPKTSSSVREAPAAAGELSSAAPALTAEAAGAQAQASPLTARGEPPKVAQLQTAAQAVKQSTEEREKRLSVHKASEQEEEKKKDAEKDTPSITATPGPTQPAQPHLGDTCASVESEIDDAAMRKKIVVVEEIVEVKRITSPQAAGGLSTPPPVTPETEGEELDLDVLEALAIERALLSEPVTTTLLGVSPDEDWDHTLDEPEDKTWPNFIEGWFESMPINLLPVLSCSLCVMSLLLPGFLPSFDVWEVRGGSFDDGPIP